MIKYAFQYGAFEHGDFEHGALVKIDIWQVHSK